MSFLEKMQNRYTTKVYDTSKKLTKTQIDDLKEVLRLSPSSINSQPWQFTFVSDTETKNKLGLASFFNNERIQNCDTLVVFSAINNLELFENQINKGLPEAAVGYYNQFIKPLPKSQIMTWFEKQTYLALGVFLSACAEMDIDATPMEGVEPEKYDAILKQKDYTTLMAVAIGYRDQDDFNQPSKKAKSRRAQEEVIVTI